MSELKCPICSSDLTRTGSTTYVCPFCGARFTSLREGGREILIDGTGARYRVDSLRENDPAAPKRKSKSKGTVVALAILFLFLILSLGAAGFLIYRAAATPKRTTSASQPAQTTPAAPSADENPGQTEEDGDTRYVTEDLSEDMSQILPLIFHKPLGQITVEELDSILYFSTSASIITDLRTVRYSFEDYFDYEDEAAFEATVHIIELPYDMMESTIRASDLQYMQMLTYVDCEGLSPKEEDLSRHTQLKKLRLYGKSLDDIANLVNGENLLELYVGGDYVADLSGLEKFPNLQKLELDDTAVTDLKGLSICPNLISLSLIDNEKILDYRQLTQFTGLKELNLECELKDIDFLGGLPALETVSLIGTKLLRLDGLTACPNLKTLHVEGNYDLKEQEAIAQLEGLESLYLDNVESLEILRPLTNLKRLILDRFYAADDLSVLGTLVNLEYLELHGFGNGVKSFAPLKNLTNLKELILPGGGFYFNTTDIFDIASLERLDLSGSTFGSDFSQIAKLTNLKYLNLNKVHVTVNNQVHSSGYYTEVYYDSVELSEVLPAISALSSLEELHLRENEIETIDFVSPLTQLRYLDISDNYVKDFAPLSSCTSLTTVIASGNPLMAETVPEGITVLQ